VTSGQPLVVPYESSALSYHIQLPIGFRRSDCLSAWRSRGATLGVDVFTPLTPDEERAKERGHTGGGYPAAGRTFSVIVFNADGRSALEWARELGSFGGEERHSSAVVSAYEAVRTAVRGEARLYVVRVEGLIYLISLPPGDPVLPSGFLDSVASTFRARPARPTPTPTPPPAITPAGPYDAAAKLAAALEAGDVGRLAGVITPRCWLEEWLPNAGTTGRAVDPYLAELAKRFAGGDLRVRVDPAVQVATEDGPGGLRFFVRSDWTEAARTTRIDLFLREIDGRWYWSGALVRAMLR
jgi:hypothetical protein